MCECDNVYQGRQRVHPFTLVVTTSVQKSPNCYLHGLLLEKEYRGTEEDAKNKDSRAVFFFFLTVRDWKGLAIGGSDNNLLNINMQVELAIRKGSGIARGLH